MTDLNTLASSALVNIYNRLVPDASSDGMPLAQVKKFSDKATAVKRVTSILATVNETREKDGMLPLIVADDGSVIELPESGVPSTGSAETDELRDSGALDARVAKENIEELVPTETTLTETAPTEVVVETSDQPKPEATEVPEPPKVDISITKRAAPKASDQAPAPVKTATRRGPSTLGGRPPLVGVTDIITLLHKGDNPKRAEAARRFAKYRDGMSVQDYIDAVGDRRQALRDIAWDMKMEWVTISGAPKTKRASKDVPAEAVEESAATDETAEDVAPETEATSQAA